MNVSTQQKTNLERDSDLIESIVKWSSKNYKRNHAQRLTKTLGSVLMYKQFGEQNYKTLLFDAYSKSQAYKILSTVKKFTKSK